MNNNKRLFLLGLLFCLTSLQSLADDDNKLDHFISLSLEDLVSLETTIATATRRTVSKAPAVVTLITSEDIKATGSTNLVEILQSVPGIHIRSSQFANRPLVHFRGAKATQTLIMINGNSQRDLVWNQGIFWKGIPASAIERIEIIRGPGSALFGADASAGVINVITRTTGRIEESEAGVRTGSFNTREAWLQHGSLYNGFEIGLTASFFSTDGHAPFINSDGQSASDTVQGTDVSYAPGDAEFGWDSQDIRFSLARKHWRLQADYNHHNNVETGLTGYGVLDPVTRGNDTHFNLDMFYNDDRFTDNWSLDTELRYQHLDYTSGTGFQERPPGYTDASGTYPDGQINQQSAAERRLVFNISSLYSGFNNHALRIGAGYTWQDLYSVEHRVNFGSDADGASIPAGSPLLDISGSPYAFAPEKTRKIAHLFIEDIWQLNPVLELTAGARYDDYSDFGDTVNPRAALVWQTTDRLISKLIYGQAFRAPTYLELYSVTSRSLPNLNLEPERSETLDLAFSYTANASLLLNLNLFYFDQTHLIDTDDNMQYQNLGDHTIRGIELEARWQTSDNLYFLANYTVREQDDTSFRAIQEPDQQAYFRVDWSFMSQWNLNLQANWIGDRERKAIDTRPAVDSYLITDTTLRYRHTDNWEFALSIRNLLDEDAREYTGTSITEDLPLAQRNAYAELRYQF